MGTPLVLTFDIGTQSARCLLVKPDGSFQLIRRAETPADYFRTFDCFDFYKKVLSE